MSADDTLIGALADAFGRRVFDTSSISGEVPSNPALLAALVWFMRVRVGRYRRLGNRGEALVRRWLERHANRGGGLFLERDDFGWFQVRQLSAAEADWVRDGGGR
jgi:hypothetical protein